MSGHEPWNDASEERLNHFIGLASTEESASAAGPPSRTIVEADFPSLGYRIQLRQSLALLSGSVIERSNSRGD